MKKIFNNESNNFEEWTTKKLKAEAKAYDYMIYGIECYGSHDIQNFRGICIELEKRNIVIKNKIYFN